MTTGSPREPAPVIPLVAIDECFPAHRREAAIRRSLEAGCLVMVMAPEEGTPPPELLDAPGVHRHPSMPRARRGDMIRAMAAAAGLLSATHLITLDPRICCEPEIAALVAEMRTHPEAVVCGVRRRQRTDGHGRYGPGRALANFWFRVQTGIPFTDSTGGLRAYPLGVVERLGTLCRGAAFDYEMLVRTAWAGVVIREAVAAAACRQAAPTTLAEGFVYIGLQIHLTMRSIVPWPHRRLAGRDPGDASISLLHPRRSLKILVGQNISATRLGLSAALGVFLGTLPLIACHSIATLFAAGFFRLSKVAALSAGQICMPPIVPALCIEVGYYLRHGTFLTEISLRTIGYEALDRLLEWVIGSVFLAPVLAAAAGGAVYVMARHIAQRAVGDRAPETLKDK